MSSQSESTELLLSSYPGLLHSLARARPLAASCDEAKKEELRNEISKKLIKVKSSTTLIIMHV